MDWLVSVEVKASIIEVWCSYLDIADIISQSRWSHPWPLNNTAGSVAIGWASCLPEVLHALRGLFKSVTLDPLAFPEAGSIAGGIPDFTICRSLDNFTRGSFWRKPFGFQINLDPKLCKVCGIELDAFRGSPWPPRNDPDHLDHWTIKVDHCLQYTS